MPRALAIVLDSVGIGHAPDAADFGDDGADTVGHILRANPGLTLSHLDAMGLTAARAGAAGGKCVAPAGAACGWMREKSRGKDTTTGHWEIAGTVLEEPFATFEHFPPEILEPIEREAGVSFIGNCAQSGTVILDELGDEHVRTGHPILYTSADSVMQIAAHEAVVPLERLYEICRIARRVCDASGWVIGRAIARPFEGESGAYRRTANRRDFSLMPPPNVLDELQHAAVPVHGVGKIGDIFAGSGIDVSHPTKSNRAGMETTARIWSELKDGFVFVNLVDFDMLFGHRRDPRGYGAALKEFDDWLGEFLSHVRADDLFLITADHGNDPTWIGTDHTREAVPLLVRGGGYSGCLGGSDSFAVVAQMLRSFFAVPS